MIKISELIRKLKISTRRKVFSEFIGDYRSAFKGQGIEFDDLREYVAGDNVKDIDWNSTAKTGTVYVRKYIETRELNLLFALDISSSMNWGSDPSYFKKDIAINAMYAIVQAALRSSDRFGACLFADTVVRQLELKKGFQHLLEILKAADTAYTNDYFKQSNLLPLLNFLLQKLNRKVVCFLITDNIDLDNLEVAKLLRSANVKHEINIIHIMDQQELQPQFAGEMFFQDIETGQNATVDLSSTAALATYQENLSRYLDQLIVFTKQNRIGYLRLTQESDIIVELITFFSRRHYAR